MKAFYMGVAGEFLISVTVRPQGILAELSGANRADSVFSLGACRPKSLIFFIYLLFIYLFILFFFFVVSAFEVTEGILLLYAATSYNTDQERVWEVGDCGPIA